jgi:hypothetical protein
MGTINVYLPLSDVLNTKSTEPYNVSLTPPLAHSARTLESFGLARANEL